MHGVEDEDCLEMGEKGGEENEPVDVLLRIVAEYDDDRYI